MQNIFDVQDLEPLFLLMLKVFKDGLQLAYKDGETKQNPELFLPKQVMTKNDPLGIRAIHLYEYSLL